MARGLFWICGSDPSLTRAQTEPCAADVVHNKGRSGGAQLHPKHPQCARDCTRLLELQIITKFKLWGEAERGDSRDEGDHFLRARRWSNERENGCLL